MKPKVEFSFRYGVFGYYKDRNRPIVRFYVPFFRLTIQRRIKSIPVDDDWWTVA